MTEKPARAPSNNYNETGEQFSEAFESHINPWSAVITLVSDQLGAKTTISTKQGYVCRYSRHRPWRYPTSSHPKVRRSKKDRY